MNLDSAQREELNRILKSREETGLFSATCSNCGQKFQFAQAQLPENFRKLSIVSVDCTNCAKPNRLIVEDVLKTEIQLRAK